MDKKKCINNKMVKGGYFFAPTESEIKQAKNIINENYILSYSMKKNPNTLQAVLAAYFGPQSKMYVKNSKPYKHLMELEAFYDREIIENEILMEPRKHAAIAKQEQKDLEFRRQMHLLDLQERERIAREDERIASRFQSELTSRGAVGDWARERLKKTQKRRARELQEILNVSKQEERKKSRTVSRVHSS